MTVTIDLMYVFHKRKPHQPVLSLSIDAFEVPSFATVVVCQIKKNELETTAGVRVNSEDI